MTLKNRLEKLEKIRSGGKIKSYSSRLARLQTQQRKAGHMTWKKSIVIDAAGIANLMERDPKFAAAWNKFTAGMQPSETLQQVTHES